MPPTSVAASCGPIFPRQQGSWKRPRPPQAGCPTCLIIRLIIRAIRRDPVGIRPDRQGLRREQARSVWSRPDRRRAPAYGSGGWGFESLAARQTRSSEAIRQGEFGRVWQRQSLSVKAAIHCGPGRRVLRPPGHQRRHRSSNGVIKQSKPIGHGYRDQVNYQRLIVSRRPAGAGRDSDQRGTSPLTRSAVSQPPRVLGRPWPMPAPVAIGRRSPRQSWSSSRPASWASRAIWTRLLRSSLVRMLDTWVLTVGTPR
jgi:hypothetical protein